MQVQCLYLFDKGAIEHATKRPPVSFDDCHHFPCRLPGGIVRYDLHLVKEPRRKKIHSVDAETIWHLHFDLNGQSVPLKGHKFSSSTKYLLHAS